MTRVRTEIADHIAHVTLARPDKLNGIDQQMAEAIVAAGDNLARKPDLRAVVLSGEGRAFCAGLDVASFAQLAAGDPHEVVMPRLKGRDTNLFQELVMVWRRLPVPVIAALHGVCFGAGFQLALGADIRIAHPDTRLAIMEMKWGLVPDMGGMVLMPRLMPDDVIRRLTFTAEEVPASQGAKWGMVTELAEDPLAAATALASQIAQKSPSAVRAAKALIEQAQSGAPEAELLLAESRAQAELIGQPDQLEAIAANLQKRPPNFGPAGG